MSEDLPDLPQGDDKIKGRPSRARYDKVYHELDRRFRRRVPTPERLMREIVDLLWENFENAPYSWCGFYVLAPDGQSLTLAAHRDKPACSPLPMHGVCGRVARSGKSMIVPDVRALGDAHVECDPRNLSEVCLPVYNKDQKIFAVFDADSASLNAFDEMDERWLERILKNFEK